jgi:hypothetical protein
MKYYNDVIPCSMILSLFCAKLARLRGKGYDNFHKKTHMFWIIIILVLGLPILLGSLWLVRRGNLIGLLCWPGALFLLYLFLVTLSAYTIIGVVSSIELAQWIDDIVVASPPLIIVGLLMLRRKALGYVAGMGLLLLCCMLFIGLVPIMVIQALLKDLPIDVIGIVIVLVSGMICFIPFTLFFRGAVKCQK